MGIDIAFLTKEAIEIHQFFYGTFWSLTTVLLLLGILAEYVKFPLGLMPNFSNLVGRMIIAAMLLMAFPDIANAISGFFDSLASEIGNFTHYKVVLTKAGEALKTHSWSWSSPSQVFLLIVAYLGFYLLYVTVFFFDAAIMYAWTFLYILSPVLIALYILPVTAGATRALFRSLIEVSMWKVIWGVSGTLLWSGAVKYMNQPPADINFLTLLAYTLILSLSIVLTPMLVRVLMGQGISSMGGTLAGMAGGALSAAALGPQTLTALAAAPTKGALGGAKAFGARRLSNLKETIAERKKQNQGGPSITQKHRFSRQPKRSQKPTPQNKN